MLTSLSLLIILGASLTHAAVLSAYEHISDDQCKINGEWAHTGVNFGAFATVQACLDAITQESSCNQKIFIHNPGAGCYCFSDLNVDENDCNTFVNTGYKTYKRPACVDAPGKPGSSPSLAGFYWSHSGYWGGYIAQGTTSDVQGCAQKCEEYTGCVGFSRHRTDGNCYVYTSLADINGPHNPNHGGQDTVDDAYERCRDTLSPTMHPTHQPSATPTLFPTKEPTVPPTQPEAFVDPASCHWVQTYTEDKDIQNGTQVATFFGFECPEGYVITSLTLQQHDQNSQTYNDPTQILCCQTGGHTSVTDTCEDHWSSNTGTIHEAFCEENFAIVGIYDTVNPTVSNQQFQSTHGLTCCEVECTDYCEQGGFGINQQACQTITVPDAVDGQNEFTIECPTDTVLVKVVDDVDTGVDGVQQVTEIVCCELDNIAAPTTSPSVDPTTNPSVGPTAMPTSSIPSFFPSTKPSVVPTTNPSVGPTAMPTSSIPSFFPSTKPSVTPTRKPSFGPSTNPSVSPTTNPSLAPTTKCYGCIVEFYDQLATIPNLAIFEIQFGKCLQDCEDCASCQ